MTVFNSRDGVQQDSKIVHRRHQLVASNFFLQGAAVGYNYLIQMGSGEDQGTLDLANYVRNKLNSKDLEKYVLAHRFGRELPAFLSSSGRLEA